MSQSPNPAAPQQIAPLLALATKALRAGRPADAITPLRDAALLEPSNAIVQHDLGLACLDVGRVPDAIAALRRAVTSNPRYADAYFRLGIAFEKLGDMGGAIVAYDRATTLLPSLTEAWLRAGALVYTLGHRDEAIACFRRAAVTGGKTSFGRLGKASALLIEDRNQEDAWRRSARRESAWPRSGAAGNDTLFFAKAAADYLGVLRAIAPTAARVTDKMPFNFLWAGLIHLAFPRALIIHCRRSAIDTALSIHQTHFHPSIAFPTGGARTGRVFPRLPAAHRPLAERAARGPLHRGRLRAHDQRARISHPADYRRLRPNVAVRMFAPRVQPTSCEDPEPVAGPAADLSHWPARNASVIFSESVLG